MFDCIGASTFYLLTYNTSIIDDVSLTSLCLLLIVDTVCLLLMQVALWFMVLCVMSADSSSGFPVEAAGQ